LDFNTFLLSIGSYVIVKTSVICVNTIATTGNKPFHFSKIAHKKKYGFDLFFLKSPALFYFLTPLEFLVILQIDPN
jgi:hypothetical protein